MKKNKQNRESISEGLSRMEAARMKAARPTDLLRVLIVIVFGFLAIWTGRMQGYHMTPSGAAKTSSMLDELQMPRQLPNAPIQNEDGTMILLWDVASFDRSILSVYAPWCGPCQKELPELVENLSEKGNFVVLISKREDRHEVREQFNNLGLTDVPFYQDVTGSILLQGKVTALPTTFLLKMNGRVLDRQVGYSYYEFHRLIRRASGESDEW